jgi:methionyl-tRNA formyltransferase
LKQKVVYIGTSHTIVEKIVQHPSFDLQQIICESKRVKEIHLETAQQFDLPLIEFNDKSHFVEIINSIGADDIIFIIYQLDMIVPRSLTNKFRFFNLHAGNIATNRGAHPIIRSVLNGDTQTELTFHEIDAKIDQGMIVSTFPVDVTKEDNPATIKAKMETGIPLLLDALNQYLKEELAGTKADGGKYYKPISEIDFTIDVFADSKETIENKIRSQVQYFGAVVHHDDVKYNVNQLLDWTQTDRQDESVFLSEEYIEVHRKTESFKLKIKQR